MVLEVEGEKLFLASWDQFLLKIKQEDFEELRAAGRCGKLEPGCIRMHYCGWEVTCDIQTGSSGLLYPFCAWTRLE